MNEFQKITDQRLREIRVELNSKLGHIYTDPYISERVTAIMFLTQAIDCISDNQNPREYIKLALTVLPNAWKER